MACYLYLQQRYNPVIEETDIRTGNLVAYYDRNMQETIFTVEGVWQGYIYNTGLPLSKIPCQKANPITLDINWLESFGFIAGDPAHNEDPAIYSLKYNRLNSIHICVRNECFQPMAESPSGMIPYGRPLVHVHQLQNFFHALTREDL
ncbi:hypothetical protein CLV59_10852 [Chitinophaga dinghuensis]|uniref:Uncharacterized protein n=1 Tax=Chitinophaga dinghuensis TaxID=1539050 RepID=A0A327VN65_9BACT|nr:hypothetical protein [Chitinophaga dinghuensis]RAJ76533.1 hypothetical protein CLV59_10852 [Chitinophaga dinghuensis]